MKSFQRLFKNPKIKICLKELLRFHYEEIETVDKGLLGSEYLLSGGLAANIGLWSDNIRNTTYLKN